MPQDRADGLVNIGSLPEPMLTQIYVSSHMESLGHNELTYWIWRNVT